MKRTMWFERTFTFGLSIGMLPFYLERLSGTYARLRDKVQGYPEDALSLQLHDKWSVKQNIGHLGEVDRIAIRRIEEMINGVSPMSPAVVQASANYNQQPVEDVLTWFRVGREDNLSRYQSLGEEELKRTSLHPRLKVWMSPVDLAWFDAEHDDHHLVTIQELLNEL